MTEPAAAARRCQCGGAMEPVTVDHVSHWGPDGVWVRVTGAPAWRCFSCREIVHEGDVAQRLEDLVRAGMEGADHVEPLAVKRYPLPGRTDSPARDRNRAPTRN